MPQITFRQLDNIGRRYQKQIGKKRFTHRHWTLMLTANLHNLDRIHCYLCGLPDIRDLVLHHIRYGQAYYCKFGIDRIANDVYHQELKEELMNEKLTDDDIIILCKDCHKDITNLSWEIMEAVRTQDEDNMRQGFRWKQFNYAIPFWWGMQFSLYDLECDAKLRNIVCNTIIGDRKNDFKHWGVEDEHILLSKGVKNDSDYKIEELKINPFEDSIFNDHVIDD